MAPSSENKQDDDSKEADVMHHHHHQRFYQYGGPPSIVMGTWGDRSRSQFAAPPAPFAMPPAGVPGGRLGPTPNRITAGYHSLQYTPTTTVVVPAGVAACPAPPNGAAEFKVLEKKGSAANTNSSKYTSSSSRDGSGDQQQLHKLPQVIFFVRTLHSV